MKNTIIRLLVALTLIAGACADPAIVSSTALEAGHILYVGKGTMGTTFTLVITNTKVSAQFYQIYDTATVPADTAVPKLSITVPASSTYIIQSLPWICATGICVSNSSTAMTKTAGSADSIFTFFSNAALHTQ